MVGSLNLQEVTGPLVETKRLGERVLDSPDSGLPPSPSPTPSLWLPSPGSSADGRLLEQDDHGFPTARQQRHSDPLINSPFQIAGFGPRLHPLSFGEGVEVDPLPPKEIRYTSSVKYDSDRHYIDNVFLQHLLGVGSCSQNVVCCPDCTGRNYKTEAESYEMQRIPQRFLRRPSSCNPKYAKTVYTTTVDSNCRKAVRRFLSSVEPIVTGLH
ncbi:LOW QUALITY PROTEIN: refilin B [Leucoraja erinacea]|uniref:LOW QUALITY PROTEIN: refilin B n=1 Tax=Leucoraja erinaceus TaxID=7782 RepID=UPI002454A31A|nr:LOW QUALITY PROTEIN: refilin B [Leucoraja erinacea]